MRKYLAAALLAACTAAHAGLILSESVYPGWWLDISIGIENFGLILSE